MLVEHTQADGMSLEAKALRLSISCLIEYG